MTNTNIYILRSFLTFAALLSSSLSLQHLVIYAVSVMEM